MKRSDIADKFYGYHSKNNINDPKSAINYLDQLIEFLDNYQYESDNDFIMEGNKKSIYDEIVSILDGTKKEENPIYFILGSLEEFICNNNYISSMYGHEKIEKNNQYFSKGYICLEEKKYAMQLINKIKSAIADNENKI